MMEQSCIVYAKEALTQVNQCYMCFNNLTQPKTCPFCKHSACESCLRVNIHLN